MLRRALLASLLLVAGAPMLGTAETALLGVLLMAVGLAVIVLPAYLERSRSG
jgi:hypothetical protein